MVVQRQMPIIESPGKDIEYKSVHWTRATTVHCAERIKQVFI